MGALEPHVRSVHYRSAVCVYHQPTQVQLMRGEFLKTVQYWVGVVALRLCVITEKKVSQHSCVWGSVWFDSQSISGFARWLELI